MSEVISYKINFYVDQNQNRYGGVIANIMLWGSNNRFLGTVNFLDPGSPVPPLAIGDNGTLTVNMPISQFALIVDLLRNEKPIFYAQMSSGNIVLCSLFEPVGEAES